VLFICVWLSAETHIKSYTVLKVELMFLVLVGTPNLVMLSNTGFHKLMRLTKLEFSHDVDILIIVLFTF